MYKLSLRKVFLKAIKVYKEQWKTLLLISGIYLIILYAMGLSTFLFTDVLSLSRFWIFVINLIALAELLFFVYFSARMYASLILASKSGYSKKKCRFRDVYKEAGPVTWRVIACYILLGLIYVIPLFITAMSLELPRIDIFEIPFVITAIAFLSGLIPLLTLLTLFYFLTSVAIIYRHPKSIWGYSVKLLKNNSFTVFLLALIGIIGVLFPNMFHRLIYMYLNQFLQDRLISIIEMIPTILVMPFFATIKVSALLMIEENNQMEFASRTQAVKVEEISQFNYL